MARLTPLRHRRGRGESLLHFAVACDPHCPPAPARPPPRGLSRSAGIPKLESPAWKREAIGRAGAGVGFGGARGSQARRVAALAARAPADHPAIAGSGVEDDAAESAPAGGMRTSAGKRARLEEPTTDDYPAPVLAVATSPTSAPPRRRLRGGTTTSTSGTGR